MRRTWLLAVAVLVLLGLAAGIYSGVRRPINDPDALDYLQIGMHLAGGQGFASGQASAPVLKWLQARGYDLEHAQDVPMLLRFPFPVSVEAVLLRLGIEPYTAAFGYSLLGALYSGVALFALVGRLFGSWPVALLLGLGFVLSEPSLGFARSGMTEPFAQFFFVAALCVLVSARSDPVRALLVGALAGFAYLNRTTHALFIFLPLILVGLAVPLPGQTFHWRSYILRVLMAFGALFVLTSPWLVRNLLVTGDPFFRLTNAGDLLSGVKLPPGVTASSTFALVALVLQYPGPFLDKLLRNLILSLLTLPTLLVIGKLLILPFALGVLGLLAPLVRKVGSLRSVLPDLSAPAQLTVDVRGLGVMGVVSVAGFTGNLLGVSFNFLRTAAFIRASGRSCPSLRSLGCCICSHGRRFTGASPRGAGYPMPWHCSSPHSMSRSIRRSPTR